MGCASSKSETRVVLEAPTAVSELELLTFEGPLLIRLLSAHNLPSLDIGSESDVYVKAELVGSDAAVVAAASWPIKWDATNPLWDSARAFGSEPPAKGSELKLHFYDHDDLNKDDLIGTAAISTGMLGGAEVKVPIKMSGIKPLKAGPPYCVLRREMASRFTAKKTIYVVRHGESVWNKAQADKDVGAMMSDVDHPLNEKGREQAEGLLNSIKAGGAHAEELLAVPAVMCSPLTRAVQTCLIGLEPLLLQEGCDPYSVALNPNLREKRNLGGKDSSGKWTGAALKKGVAAETAKLYSDAPERAETLNRVELGLSQVQNKWWLGSKESEPAVYERIAELLSQVRYSNFESQVLVGHSHYFREMFRKFASGSCVLLDAEGKAMEKEEMCAKKLSNAGIAKVVLDFGADADAPLMSVQLLFGTKLIS